MTVVRIDHFDSLSDSERFIRFDAGLNHSLMSVDIQDWCNRWADGWAVWNPSILWLARSKEEEHILGIIK